MTFEDMTPLSKYILRTCLYLLEYLVHISVAFKTSDIEAFFLLRINKDKHVQFKRLKERDYFYKNVYHLGVNIFVI